MLVHVVAMYMYHIVVQFSDVYVHSFLLCHVFRPQFLPLLAKHPRHKLGISRLEKRWVQDR